MKEEKPLASTVVINGKTYWASHHAYAMYNDPLDADNPLPYAARPDFWIPGEVPNFVDKADPAQWRRVYGPEIEALEKRVKALEKFIRENIP